MLVQPELVMSDTDRDVSHSGLVIEAWVSKKFGADCKLLPQRKRRVQGIVIHATDGNERMGAARDCCAWFDVVAYKDPKSGAIVKKPRGEAHYACDARDVVRYADPNRNVAHANAVNEWTIGVEIVGKANQTREQWLDELSTGALVSAAKLCAYLCVTHGIEVAKLTHEQIRAVHSRSSDATGFLGHVDVRDALGSGNHYDPGPHFPWLEFLLSVRAYVEIGAS